VDKQSIKRQNFFDIDGNHPNIQTARDRVAIRDYVLKEQGHKFEEGTFSTSSKKSLWKAALEAPTAAEFMEKVAEASPRDYILQYDRVESFSQKKKQKQSEYISEYQNFCVPGELQRYVEGEFVKKVSRVVRYVPPLPGAPKGTSLEFLLMFSDFYRTDRRHCCCAVCPA
jgi:hypothetical protein